MSTEYEASLLFRLV